MNKAPMIPKVIKKPLVPVVVKRPLVPKVIRVPNPDKEKMAVIQAKLGDRFWRLNNLYTIQDAKGRRITFIFNDVQLILYKGIWYLNDILKARQEGCCLDPNTKILTRDLEWVSLRKIKVGEKVVAVDEFPPGGRGKGREMKTTIIEGKRSVNREAFKIEMSNGKTLIATGEHKFLFKKRGATDTIWRAVEDSRVGDEIRFITRPWGNARSYEDGWIGGMIDGEGSLAKKSRTGANISITQVEGSVLNRLIKYFKDNKYSYRMEWDFRKPEDSSTLGRKPVARVVLSKMNELFKLFGKTRPSRFSGRYWWEGKSLPGKKTGEAWSKIVSINSVGRRKMIDLQTTDKTYIAEGFVSHNSTFLNIYFLDVCLWNEDKAAGIICDTLTNAKQFLEKIRYAYDNLSDWMKERVGIKSYSKSADGAGIWFTNGSSIRVGTSFRSGTLQYLHISELGKICKVSPEKAREIKAGALNTVQVGQQVFIESTAEGAEGLFYDITKKAEDLQISGAKLTKMDYKFHFFAWWQDKKYAFEKPEDFKFSDASEKYFEDLRVRGIPLTDAQKFWYVKKLEEQGDTMKKEFPSYPEEAFEASNEAKYWADLIRKVRSKNQISDFEPDEALDVHTVWDLGIGRDSMTIWFFQIFGKEIRLVDYYEEHGEGFSHYARVLKEKDYNYGKHFAPFDIMVQEMGKGITRLEAAELAGIYFERVEKKSKDKHGQTKTTIHSALPKIGLEEGRDLVRVMIPNCWFRKSHTARGIECLEKYSKKWNEALGGWGDQKKDEYEQCASSFRYLAIAVTLIGIPDESKSEEEEYARARAIPSQNITLNYPE